MGKFIVYGLILIAMVGCQTSQLKQFSKVQTGMDKSEVLNLVGSPQHKIRKQNLDHWNYHFFEANEWHEKSVHLDQGVVIYIGPKIPSPISAEEQDRINDERNKSLDEADKKKKHESRRAFQDYELELDVNSKIRYAPTFVPIE